MWHAYEYCLIVRGKLILRTFGRQEVQRHRDRQRNHRPSDVLELKDSEHKISRLIYYDYFRKDSQRI